LIVAHVHMGEFMADNGCEIGVVARHPQDACLDYNFLNR
jgi:hypothetical protein